MSRTKNAIAHEGNIYVSVPEAARLLGTTVPKLRQFAVAEGLEFQNFRADGRFYIAEEALNAYMTRLNKAPIVPRR